MAVSIGGLVFGLLVAVLLAVAAAWVVRHYALPTVARRTLGALRVDGPALAVGALLLAGAALVVARAADPAAPIVSGAVAVLLAAGVAGLTVAVANLDLYRALGSMEATSPDAVEPGPAVVRGTVAETDVLVPSPVTDTDCVAYDAVARQEHAVLGRGYESSVQVPASTARATTDFALVPEDGRSGDTETDAADPPAADAHSLVVDGAAASFPLLAPTRVLQYTPGGRAVAGRTRSVDVEPGMTAPIGDALERGTRSRPRTYAERRVDPGDPVTVLGTARRTADGDLRLEASDDGPPLVVAACSPDVLRSHARSLVVRWGSFGALCLLGGLWLARPMLS